MKKPTRVRGNAPVPARKEGFHITTETNRTNGKTFLATAGGSDTKPINSLLSSAEKKTDFGHENGLRQEQDKEVAHSASLPLPRCSDSGKPTWRDSRRKAYSHDERKDLRSLAYAFGGDLLERMSSDQEMMKRIHAKEEARKILLKAMGFVPGRPIPHANVKTVFDGESNVDDEDKEFIEGGFVYMKEKPKEAKAYDA